MILIRLVVGPLQVNCFILADEKTRESIVIDPGDDAGDIIKTIKDKGLKVKYIVNTHGHFDHVGASRGWSLPATRLRPAQSARPTFRAEIS